jgi:hypothetical protein
VLLRQWIVRNQQHVTDMRLLLSQNSDAPMVLKRINDAEDGHPRTLAVLTSQNLFVRGKLTRLNRKENIGCL